MYEKMKAELLKRLHAKDWAYSMRLMQKGYIAGIEIALGILETVAHETSEQSAIPQQPQAGSEASPKPCATCKNLGIESKCNHCCYYSDFSKYEPRTASALR